MTTKRNSLFAALAFALPIAALVATPAMAAKHPKKHATHHVHKVSGSKVGAHKAPHKKVRHAV